MRHQLQDGGWPWMYYVSSGKVIDYYPLFSVHQDAMAPMSLLQLQNVTGKDYSEFVLLSLKWLDKNILGETMILSGKETVWRAIQRRPGGFRELYLGLGPWALFFAELE